MVLSLQRIDKKVALMLAVIMVLVAVAYLAPVLVSSQVYSLEAENSVIGISKPLVYNAVLRWTGSSTLAQAVASFIVSIKVTYGIVTWYKFLALLAVNPWYVLVAAFLSVLYWYYVTYDGMNLYWI